LLPPASPVVAAGRVYTLGITEILSRDDLESGRLVWRKDFSTQFPTTSPDFGTEMSPLLVHDVVVFSGLDNGVIAVRPVRSGSAWSVEQVWKTDAVGMYMNSPVLKGHLVFGFSHKNRGQFFCLDAASGRTLWLGDGRQGENAAMVLAGEFVVSLTNDASLIVSKASATVRPGRTRCWSAAASSSRTRRC